MQQSATKCKKKKKTQGGHPGGKPGRKKKKLENKGRIQGKKKVHASRIKLHWEDERESGQGSGQWGVQSKTRHNGKRGRRSERERGHKK